MTTTTIDPVKIRLDIAHDAQRRVLDEAERFNVLACGRRWGKTSTGLDQIGIPAAVTRQRVGWFAPTYKLLDEAWHRATDILRPMGAMLNVSKQERSITLSGGGALDFWTLAGTTQDASQAGRGRAYHVVIVDESAHARYLEQDWTKAIRATLSDFKGSAWFLSTPRGRNYFWRLWTRGETGERGWKSWKQPTAANPFISPAEIEEARRSLPADAFQQEYLAEFLADAANPFGINAIHACVLEPWQQSNAVAAWGVDLAKSHDWTVAIGLDTAGRCVAFQRWQSDWRNTASRLAAMLKHTPALVDSTGVGDPIVEQLQARCGATDGYKFTSQSKQQLMEGLAVAIQQRQVGFPDGVIVHELESYQYEYKAGGRVCYTAPEGMHDDTVCALALAVRCLNAGPTAASLRVEGYDGAHDHGFDHGWLTVENEAIWR